MHPQDAGGGSLCSRLVKSSFLCGGDESGGVFGGNGCKNCNPQVRMRRLVRFVPASTRRSVSPVLTNVADGRFWLLGMTAHLGSE